jgi:hypothetical protein
MTTALVLAGMAIAWLLFTRKDNAPVAALPPLVPSPALALPTAPATPGGFSLNPFIPWGIVAALAWFHFSDKPAPHPVPTPTPAPVVGLDLRGKFVGPEAASDAATTAALLGEIADKIEVDGTEKEPRLHTGAAFDDLRRAAREIRTNGVSLGARQPAVRDAVKAFLDSEAGTDGGPVDAAKRAVWVKAYRAVSKAAEAATK